MLRSDLCDHSDAYIVVNETINMEGKNNRDMKSRSVAFKNNAPFINCISKINNVLIDNTGILDVLLDVQFNWIQ